MCIKILKKMSNKNKTCAKCGKIIDEKKKFCMTITKEDGRILEFESFHFPCWRDFLIENLRMLLTERR